jgi:hypothetical protein
VRNLLILKNDFCVFSRLAAQICGLWELGIERGIGWDRRAGRGVQNVELSGGRDIAHDSPEKLICLQITHGYCVRMMCRLEVIGAMRFAVFMSGVVRQE